MSDFSKAAMAPAPKSASRARWLVLPLVALVFLQLLPLFATVAGLWGELLGLEKIGGRVGLAIGQVFVLLSTAILAWRLALFARYRPVPSVCDAQLPHITVIVPAYNEGPQVLKTLRPSYRTSPSSFRPTTRAPRF